jgi:hypothetical protein
MGYGGRTLGRSEAKWKAPRGELYAMAYACRKLKNVVVGREVYVHTDHIAWSDLQLKSTDRILMSYLMDILEVAPRGLYIRGELNRVADTITRLLRRAPYMGTASAMTARLAVPTDMRKEVLREAHEGAIGGHFGRSSMLRAISTKYVPWRGITDDIAEYRCTHCERFKKDTGRYASKAGPIQAYSVNKPWELIGLDVETMRGSDGIVFSYLYVICFFSKFAEGIMMANNTAGEVVRALKNSTAWQVGIPKSITGDNDAAFTRSDVFVKFLDESGIDWIDKDAHHHEGVIERGVQTFKRVLEAKVADGLGARAALKATGDAVTKGHVACTTGYTPHKLVYGSEYVTALHRRIERAARNTEKAKHKMEKDYNKDKANVTYEVGEKVWVRDPRKFIPRGEPKFLGPYRIIEIKGHSCKVWNKYTKRVYSRNIADLRRVSGEIKETQPEARVTTRDVISDHLSRLDVDRGDPRMAEGVTGQTVATGTPPKANKEPSMGVKVNRSPTRAPSFTPDDLVGKRIEVKWPDGNWYHGKVVKTCNNAHGSHQVRYDPDHTGSNKVPVFENLTGNSRARGPVEEWRLEPGKEGESPVENSGE